MRVAWAAEREEPTLFLQTQMVRSGFGRRTWRTCGSLWRRSEAREALGCARLKLSRRRVDAIRTVIHTYRNADVLRSRSRRGSFLQILGFGVVVVLFFGPFMFGWSRFTWTQAGDSEGSPG